MDLKSERLDMRVTPKVKQLAAKLAELDRRKLSDWVEQLIIKEGERQKHD